MSVYKVVSKLYHSSTTLGLQRCFRKLPSREKGSQSNRMSEGSRTIISTPASTTTLFSLLTTGILCKMPFITFLPNSRNFFSITRLDQHYLSAWEAVEKTLDGASLDSNQAIPTYQLCHPEEDNFLCLNFLICYRVL